MNGSLPFSGSALRVVDDISNRIHELGVRHVFTMTSGGAMFLNDDIASHPRLEAVCNHHDQTSPWVRWLTRKTKTIRPVLTHDGLVICEIICPKCQDIVQTLGTQETADGKIVARPAEDMAPFLGREEFSEEMIVAPLEGSKD